MKGHKGEIKDKRAAGEQERDRRIKKGWIAYMLFGIVMTMLGFAVLVKGSITSTRDAAAWDKLLIHTSPDVSSAPNRGNIYSDMGIPLAISVPMYDTRIDFRAGGFNDSIFLTNVDTLAEELAGYFGGESKASYKNRLMNGYNEKKRATAIVRREINHVDFGRLKSMPYFKSRSNNTTGLTATRYIRRNRPYNTLAQRTIGGLKRDADSIGITHGNSGLEMAFDSLLCGEPGIDQRIRVHNSYKRVPRIPPKDGLNVYTTLNVDIQDITERALRKKLVEVNADWGTAVVMEVKTGQIKAISNLDRVSEGHYTERTNHALADLLVPGSTFKTASMLVALNEGYCAPKDSVDTGNGIYHYARGLTIKDHNAHKGGYGKITLDQAMWYSSNIGVAKVLLEGFEGENKKFLDRLNGMNIFDPIELEIPGTANAMIKQDASTWSKSTLPWVSFGYELEIPPIYTLRFYNAIANGGTMMEPYLVNSVGNERITVWSKKPKVINKQIASKQSIRQMQEMLRGVVLYGTGKDMNSPFVEIAGKTGTTQIYQQGSSWGGAGHMVTFCGYFPANDPQYSCIVVVFRPKGVYPAGNIPGAVLVEIAEQTVATTRNIPIKSVKADSLATFDQHVSSGLVNSVERSLELTKAHVDALESRGTWLQHLGGDSLQLLHRADPIEGQMPDLIGMATEDAIYLSEQLGLRVSISGRKGYVKRQSIKAGQTIRKGQSVHLTL
ncbi:MAG: penicillin-binding transpeptidase domain-containing protein [Porphyromonas sp.]|nr:penicillin-binding transpeptidase domain-containing protein [Porphyromonas sp.]